MARPSAPRLRFLAAHAALLGLLVYTWRAGAVRDESGSTVSTGGLRFREVSREVGIDFVHRPTRVDPLVANIAAQITAVGAGVSVVDADGDGWPDLYAVSSAHGAPNALYRNRGDGTFEDAGRARRAGRPEPRGRGVLDGLGLGRLRRRRATRTSSSTPGGVRALFRNEGRARVHRRHRGLRARALDELQRRHLARLRPRRAARPVRRPGTSPRSTTCGTSRPRASCRTASSSRRTAGRNRLFREHGDGTFEDVTRRTGADSTRWTSPPWRPTSTATAGRTCTWPTTTVPRSCFLNRGGERFELAQGIGLEAESKSGMCVALGDARNDGRLDGLRHEHLQARLPLPGQQPAREPRSTDGGPMVQVADQAAADCGWAWGAQFGDLDNDGAPGPVRGQRLHLAEPRARLLVRDDQDRRGHGRGDRRTRRTGRRSRTAASRATSARASCSARRRARRYVEVGRGGRRRRPLRRPRRGAGRPLRQRGASTWSSPTKAARCSSTATSPATRTTGWPSSCAPRRATASALGAEVELEFAGARQVQVVVAASGFASQNERRLHFGLGRAPGRVRAAIRWPSGRQQVLEDLELDRVHAIFEELE